MARKTKRTGEKPLVSKFQQKRVDQATGIRPSFEFRERMEEPAHHAMTATSMGSVRASVTKVCGTARYAFLITGDGQVLYLSLVMLKRTYGNTKLKEGCSVECDIEHLPDKKYPCVSRVISVSGPSAA